MGNRRTAIARFIKINHTNSVDQREGCPNVNQKPLPVESTIQNAGREHLDRSELKAIYFSTEAMKSDIGNDDFRVLIGHRKFRWGRATAPVPALITV